MALTGVHWCQAVRVTGQPLLPPTPAGIPQGIKHRWSVLTEPDACVSEGVLLSLLPPSSLITLCARLWDTGVTLLRQQQERVDSQILPFPQGEPGPPRPPSSDLSQQPLPRPGLPRN